MQMSIQPPVQLPADRNSVPSQQPTGTPSIAEETVPDSMPLVWGYFFKGKGLSKTATKKQYASYLQKYRGYCGTQGINPICPSEEDGINFLAELCDSGVG